MNVICEPGSGVKSSIFPYVVESSHVERKNMLS
jgi:hypothetical protein